MAWDERYRAFLQELDQDKPVITCGDFNVAHNEIDLKNPGPNRGNAGWRIDYFLVSDRIADRVVDATIHADVFGSDHCPVGLEICL